MNHTYQLLTEEFQRLAQISHAITFLQWDQLVMMPPGGNDARAKAIAELTTMHHELLCSAKLEDLLNSSLTQAADPDQKRSLAEMARVRDHATCIPAGLIKAKSLAGSKCEHGWRIQRKENDWPGFLKNFTAVVDLARQEAQARQAAAPDRLATPYDGMLDLYCTGDSSHFIEEVFITLKREIPRILAATLARQTKEPVNLDGFYHIEHQKQLNHKLMQLLGFDFEKGRLDVSMHPFSTGGRGDQRITTRFRETDFLDALLATAHETGHACYENGLPEKWDGLPIGRARNMCIHESQSLLFEKQLFLSPPFLTFFLDVLHEHLPQSGQWSREKILAASTHVQPSFIRVEADEVTYPLHVVLRFEIEKALINSSLEARHIPEVWDMKMRQYLGLSTTGNDRDGCLQDIHWTDGSFGYFPSYTLGAINAAQLFAAIKKNSPDWQEKLRMGDLNFIHQWLTEKVWSIGSSRDSQEILYQASGETTNPLYFLDHLQEKYVNCSEPDSA